MRRLSSFPGLGEILDLRANAGTWPMIPLSTAAKKVTKKALMEYFGAMLWRYHIGATVTPADEDALRWLIQQHHEYQQKCGGGIAGFTVVETIYGARSFAIVRNDGSVTDFSYRGCFSRPSARAEVLAALRHEVADDIQDAKARYFSEHGDEFGCVRCALTGNLIDISQSHADHAPPWTFQILAEAFLDVRGVAVSYDLLEPSADNQHRRRLADRALAAAWRSFHHSKADIRVVDARANTARAEDRPHPQNRQLILEQTNGGRND
jgi:hypothetical protein